MKKDFSKYTDRELVSFLKEAKPISDLAFTEIYNRHSSKVWAYCKCMINDTEQAHDIFQETFIRFYKNVSPDARSTNLDAYLITTARNLCFNYFRDKKRTVPIDEIDLPVDFRNEYEKKELFDLVLMAIDLLDDNHKEVFIMAKFDNMQHCEIAKICGISVDGVRSRVLRARKKIIDILEPYLKDLQQ